MDHTGKFHQKNRQC